MKNQFIIIGHLIIDLSKLNKDQKLFVNAVAKANTRGEDLRIYPDYSGRGMFGATCVGVTGARSSVLLWHQKEQSCDSMGLGQIIYFRGIPALPRDSFCDHHDLIETITDYRDSDDPDEIEEVEKAKATLRRFNYEELTGRTL